MLPLKDELDNDEYGEEETMSKKSLLGTMTGINFCFNENSDIEDESIFIRRYIGGQITIQKWRNCREKK